MNEYKTASFFEYKGNLGCVISQDGKFLNDPFAEGQLGTVVSTEEIEISKEAKQLILKAKREGGSFAPLMLTRHSDEIVSTQGKSSIGILGFGFVHIGKEILIGRTCTLSVLDDCAEVENNPPEGYKDFIDNNVDKD